MASQSGEQLQLASMISRAGKFTQEKHMILQKMDEILAGNQKKYVIRQGSQGTLVDKDKNFEDKLLKKVNLVKEESQQWALPKQQSKRIETKTSKTKCSSSFETIDREQYYAPKTEKNPPPPCGYYSVNHQLVERQYPYGDWKVRNTTSIKQKEVVEPPMRIISPNDRQTGFIDFNRQKKRSEFYKTQALQPHEKHFESKKPLPQILTQTKSVTSFNIGKDIPRDDKYLRVNLTPSTYDVHDEYTKTQEIGKAGVGFKLYSDRKEMLNKHQLHPSNSTVKDNIDKYYFRQGAQKRVVTPNLKLSYSRGSSSDQLLPVHMQNIHTRTTLNSLSKKMLDTNNFSQGEFQTVLSSFQGLNRTQSQQTLGREKQNQGGLTVNSVLKASGVL